MTTSDDQKYKELEKENARLKKLAADLSLDTAILKDIAEGNRQSGGRRHITPKRSMESASAVHAG